MVSMYAAQLSSASWIAFCNLNLAVSIYTDFIRAAVPIYVIFKLKIAKQKQWFNV